MRQAGTVDQSPPRNSHPVLRTHESNETGLTRVQFSAPSCLGSSVGCERAASVLPVQTLLGRFCALAKGESGRGSRTPSTVMSTDSL